MAVSFLHPISEQKSSTCSVAVGRAIKPETWNLLKEVGATEAELVALQHKATWGVIKGKIKGGGMEEVPFAMYKVGNAEYKIGFKNGKVVAHDIVKKTNLEFSVLELEDFQDYWINPAALGDGEWLWFGEHTPKVGPVKLGSESVGAMTDEDIATMFVKTKDEIAKAKGINIKGVNVQLDFEVHQAIAKVTGYDWTEVRAKIEAYKATGKKLSSLKSKVIPKKPPKPAIIPTHAPGYTPPKYTTGEPLGTPGPAAATHAEPNGVPLAPTQEALNDVVQAVHEAVPDYLDEQVAKAYIKAKDELAAGDNPWTLYTQSDEFNSAIYNLMAKSYEIDLSPHRIEQQIARYISEQNKLSVLKKKMAKTGEYNPQADTLKKKKGDPTGSGKASKTQAQQQISDAAEAGYVPEGATPYKMTEAEERDVFNDLKNNVYAAQSLDAIYSQMEAHILKMYKYADKKPSVLDVVRAYDKLKAKSLGIENGFFYEKKVAEWAASPQGAATLKAKQEAAELLKNLPPLPADSAGYQEISTYDAKARLVPTDWTTAQQRGLREYTGGSYREMNNSLREGRRASEAWGSDLNQAIKQAQAGMRPVQEAFLVHRGTGFSQFGVHSFEEMLQLIGKTVQDKGFLSTSVGGRSAFSGTLRMEVEVPKGTYGVYVQPISQHASENEFLIAAGTKYEVLGVSQSGYQTTVRVRAIPGSHTKKMT